MTRSKPASNIAKQALAKYVLVKPILVALALLATTSFSYAQTIKVAVASNFLSTANILKPLFEKEMAKKATTLNESPHTIQIISASTGQLSHQILNGAPFDVFLSANKSHAVTVKEQLKLADDLLFKYAKGSLVLISNKALKSLPNIQSSLKQVLASGSPVQTISQELQANIIQKVLVSANKVAIANAKIAPYGLATEELLSNLNLSSRIKDKTVKGQNIAQTYQFFTSGSADAAFVARSHWLQTNKQTSYAAKSSINISTHLHNPIEQWGLVVKDTEASRAFQAFMLQPHIQAIMKNNGYGTDQ